MSLSPKQMVIDYFHFVDTEDLGPILKLLTRDCVFTVETHGVRLTGDEEISAMFERLWDHHQWVKHDQFHFVEETSGNHIAVRFRVTNKLKTGELVNKSNSHDELCHVLNKAVSLFGTNFSYNVSSGSKSS